MFFYADGICILSKPITSMNILQIKKLQKSSESISDTCEGKTIGLFYLWLFACWSIPFCTSGESTKLIFVRTDVSLGWEPRRLNLIDVLLGVKFIPAADAMKKDLFRVDVKINGWHRRSFFKSSYVEHNYGMWSLQKLWFLTLCTVCISNFKPTKMYFCMQKHLIIQDQVRYLICY